MTSPSAERPLPGTGVKTRHLFGRCLTARATHAPHRANLRCLGLSVGIAIALSACQDAPPTASADERAKLDNGQVALVAVAPDGTKLWAVRANRIVYFSSSGTQTSHAEQAGKTTRIVDDAVPAAHLYGTALLQYDCKYERHVGEDCA